VLLVKFGATIWRDHLLFKPPSAIGRRLFIEIEFASASRLAEGAERDDVSLCQGQRE
jgi:hypothetical protein